MDGGRATSGGSGSPRPAISIVSAVYNVEPYLPEFIASIEAQGDATHSLEVILVDDGSTDRSRAIIEAWRDRTPVVVTVLGQENAGQASARNAGLAVARGEWVTFADPDDILAPGYLAAALAFARRHPNVAIMAARPHVWIEALGTFQEHPRAAQFRRGDRMVDLEREPDTFSRSASDTFFRLDRVRALDLTFSEDCRPTFEDGHFTVRYVLAMAHPVMGLVASAEYRYRRRAAGDSTLQTAPSDQRRYTSVFEHGYLDVLERARHQHGRVPEWLQHVLIYELSWYLWGDERISTGIRIDDATLEPFHAAFAAVCRAIEPHVVARHQTRRLKAHWGEILAYHGRTDAWQSPKARQTAVDRRMRLQRVTYRYIGAPPEERCLLDGADIEPAWAKTQAMVYYRRPLVHVRILWLPDDPRVTLELDGVPTPIGRPKRKRTRAPGRGPRAWVRRVRRAVARDAVRARVIRFLARSPLASSFREAWVLMDRAYEADDNGERLFEHLRRAEPSRNAWFAIDPGTADFTRLRRTYGQRVIARGSLAWKLLMLNASWLISSHADLVVARPPDLETIVEEPGWKFAFLQHGVIKDDLSVWINRREVDLFIVSTEAEEASIVADGTAYRFSGREVRRTGLPRFDRLGRVAAEVPPERRDLVMIAPTWRSWLTGTVNHQSSRREVAATFRESAYLRHWMEVLRSQEVARAARETGRVIAFMPHPLMQPILDELDLPAHVVPMRFEGNDVQRLYARTALLVTDYSSVAFNLAYIDAPVVYFQFDREDVLQGGHVGRPGYFDYERDGFGPVAVSGDAAVSAIVDQLRRGPTPAPEYQARIDAAFPARDGRACERVVAAIDSHDRPHRWPADVQRVLDGGRDRARG